MRRIPWQLVLAGVLVALLVVLATLQYRWLGAVSDAERDRLRASLRARGADFSEQFDRELTRTYMAFQIPPAALDADPPAALAAAYDMAQSSSTVGGIVKAVYLFDEQSPSPAVPQRLDPVARRLTPSEWPASFDTWRSHLTAHAMAVRGFPLAPPLLIPDAIDPKAPALIIPAPRIRRVVDGDRVIVTSDPTAFARTIVVMLDRDRLERDLLASLASRYFGASNPDYVVTVVSRDDSKRVIFTSGGRTAGTVTAENADVTTGMFDLRLDEVNRLAAPPPGADGPVRDRVAIAIVRRASGADGARVLMTGGERHGAWQVLVRSSEGSLDALVARSRRRNLAISLGVLGLLAVSVVFVIGSAQRQQRLARQQMEFVTAVSHELRTPLAVIRSAGENLADGVVGDEDQVRKYGSLIRTEGRRLSDMVDRVMEFAGLGPGAAASGLRMRADVDIARVIHEAIGGVEAEARERGVAVTVDAGPPTPAVAGDADALRSAIQNIVGNAVKYTPAGGAVSVCVEPRERDVRIAVVDRGLGIDASDLPHVFEPFYRGRRTVDAQIRGSGVGLSIVRHVVDAHRGSVHIDSVADEGTTVTVTLPLAGGDVAAAGAGATP